MNFKYKIPYSILAAYLLICAGCAGNTRRDQVTQELTRRKYQFQEAGDLLNYGKKAAYEIKVDTGTFYWESEDR